MSRAVEEQQPPAAARPRRDGPHLRRAARRPGARRGSRTSRRRTSSAPSGRRSARRRTATCSAAGSSARCSCCARPTAASPTSASTSASPASARSAGRSATIVGESPTRVPRSAPTVAAGADVLRDGAGRDRAVSEKRGGGRARLASAAMLNAHHASRTIYVLDQDEALDFYVGKLGLEVNTDVDLGFMRWLTVSVPGRARPRDPAREARAAGDGRRDRRAGARAGDQGRDGRLGSASPPTTAARRTRAARPRASSSPRSRSSSPTASTGHARPVRQPHPHHAAAPLEDQLALHEADREPPRDEREADQEGEVPEVGPAPDAEDDVADELRRSGRAG